MKKLILMAAAACCFLACDKVEEALDDCSECNDQIDNYINEYNTTTCINNTTNLNNDCGNTASLQAAGVAKETCLEGAIQHPGICDNLGRTEMPFFIHADGPMPDSMKFDLEYNGHSLINSIDHNHDLNLVFNPKIHSGIVMEVRLYKIPGDSLLASERPTMTYDRSEETIGLTREVEIKYDPATGYSFDFINWN